MNSETEDELMQATYSALCENGFASLRMQDIADESSKSKATLHYYYDSKHELLEAFLDYLYESFAERIEADDDEPPAEQLFGLVDLLLERDASESKREFRTAILEVKAQGPYDDAYREKLERFDRLLHDRIRSIVESGQEDGSFRTSVDADDVADFIVTVVNGAQTRHVAVDHDTARTKRTLVAFVREQLLSDDAAAEVVPE